MKAIVYEGPSQLAVRDLPRPEPKEGWALVKVLCTGICGTDLHIYQGLHPRAKAPLVMGHEFSGILESDGVPGIAKGSRVTVYPLLSCGRCTPCREGNGHVCNTLGLLGIDCDGSFAEYVQAPVESIVPLADHISDELGAFVEPAAVAVHALRERGYTPGDNAVVFGCGTIGMVIALTLRVFGCQDLLMMETDPARAQMARDMGFEVQDPAKVGNMGDYCRSRTGGDGYDWVFDCAGVQPVADVLLDAVKVKGRILVVASYSKPAAMPFFYGMAKEAEILFTWVYRFKDFALAAQIVGADPNYEKVITHVLAADEAQKGFDLLTTKGTGAVKVLYRFS